MFSTRCPLLKPSTHSYIKHVYILYNIRELWTATGEVVVMSDASKVDSDWLEHDTY